ncbi:MAG: hypothetical protein IJE19_05915 [Clostridia bacterium]|nr:hypothetical protein [Clostridia bacterium]
MYRAEQKQISAEDDSVTVWGISDEKGFILDFTTDYGQAENLAALLNENSVERQHVAEIAEDLFYSG